MDPFTVDYFVQVLCGSDSVNIACCWENFILAHIGPVWFIILIKCYKTFEVKSNLWLQCDELSKCDIMSRIKVFGASYVNKILKNVYEKCRVYSEVNYSHHSKVLVFCLVLNKLSKNMILNCDLCHRVSEMSYVFRSVC